MTETNTTPLNCNHEPDPTTIEYDAKHGRRATCKHCGTTLTMTRYFLRPGDEPRDKHRMTAKERRRIRRMQHEAMHPDEKITPYDAERHNS